MRTTNLASKQLLFYDVDSIPCSKGTKSLTSQTKLVATKLKVEEQTLLKSVLAD